MSWSIGYDENWKRDIGYGVIAFCDHPGCGQEIDRGLSHVCGGAPYGGDKGCGLYFCSEHLSGFDEEQRCDRCRPRCRKAYTPSIDHPLWIRHKLTDESWQDWREENPEEVAGLRKKVRTTLSLVQRTTDEIECVLPPLTEDTAPQP